MDEVRCDRCGATWADPESIAPAVRQEVASVLRRGGPILAIRRLREVTGLELREAKAVFHHLTRTPGHCHRCGKVLDLGVEGACPQCRSLNYDW